MGKTDKATKKPKLTPTQAKVVKAKIKAEIHDIPQGRVATEVWPNASPAAASVMMSRELKKDNVQEALQKALEHYDLTPHALAGVVADALKAEKVVIVGKDEDAFADVQPDHGIRLKAAGMAANWMGIGRQAGEGGPSVHFHQHMSNQKDDYGL